MVALPWAVGILVFLFSVKSDQAIAGREQMTSGIIKRHEPSNHDRYGYDFTVNGRPYSGWQSPTQREFIIGETVSVYFDPLDPTKSSLFSFAGAWDRAIGPVFLMTVGIAAFAAYIFTRKRFVRKRLLG
jgi:hypothetical protein